MALVRVPADDPHLSIVDDIASRVPPLPVKGVVEALIFEGVQFHKLPVGPILRTPDLIVTDPGKVDLVTRIPPAQQPHLPVVDQGTRPVTGCEGGVRSDLHPPVVADFLGWNDGEILTALGARPKAGVCDPHLTL